MSDYKTLSLDTTDIDFQDIRTNLKDYLKSQDEFKDYDFDGSAMSAIIDMLAYVTHYNAINANIGINETFLQSSKFRGSVVGHARLLGYIPQSVKAPIAFVNVIVNNPSDPKMLLSKGHIFEASGGETTYQFLNTIDYETEDGVFRNVQLREGSYQTTSYEFEENSPETYIIKEKNADISTLTVEILDSKYNDEDRTVFLPAKKLSDIGPESNVYFIHETGTGIFELKFGDGVLGRKLEAGNIIRLEYLVTNVDKANGSNTFTSLESIQGNENITVEVIQRAAGGQDRESESSIKFKAPITFKAQNRAVTFRDYEGLIYDKFANVDVARAWGGEELETPIYGKVFISIKPKDSPRLTTSEREMIIRDILTPKMMTTITPELMDPDYLYLTHYTTFTYNPEMTTLSAIQLKEKVKVSIIDYSDKNLNRFDSTFHHSFFLNVVDKSDNSIVNSSSDVFVTKRFNPTLNIPRYYELNYSVALNHDVLIPSIINSTTRFSIGNITNCRLRDRFNSSKTKRIVDIVRGSESVEELVISDIGYFTDSKLVLQDFAPSFVNGTTLSVEVMPKKKNITTKENNILIVDHDSSKITPSVYDND